MLMESCSCLQSTIPVPFHAELLDGALCANISESHGYGLTTTPPMAVRLVLWSEVVLYGTPQQWIQHSLSLWMVVQGKTLIRKSKCLSVPVRIKNKLLGLPGWWGPILLIYHQVAGWFSWGMVSCWGLKVLDSVTGWLDLGGIRRQIILLNDTVCCWPVNSHHFCHHSHFVHVTIVSTLEWPIIEAGWSQWVKSLLGYSVLCEWWQHDLWLVLNMGYEAFPTSINLSTFLYPRLLIPDLFFLASKLGHLLLHMQTLGHFSFPYHVDGEMLYIKLWPVGEFFSLPSDFSLHHSTCGADPAIKQTQEFFFSFSGSYRISHNATGVSWGRSFGALMAGDREVWISAYALWSCLCSILEVPLPSYGGLWLGLLMRNSTCWKILVTRSLMTYGQTFFTRLGVVFQRYTFFHCMAVLLQSPRGLHYDSFTGARHKLYIFFPTTYTSTGSVRS